MKSVQERIEEKSASLMLEFKAPTKAYLGKKEFKELNRAFRPIERNKIHRKTYDKKSNIASLHLHEFVLQIVKTKHKSHLRVV